MRPFSLSPQICRQKAEDCLALAEKLTDPKQKVAMLQFAEWWVRLAEYTPSSAVILRLSPREHS